MSLLSVVVLISEVLAVVVLSDGIKRYDDTFSQERYRIIKEEGKLYVGGSVKLTPKEVVANQIILNLKKEELEKAYRNESEFLPSQHFFQAKPEIEKSKVFAIIKELPKGSSLHTHLLGGVSVDFIISNITYEESLYGCFINDTFKLKFLEDEKQDNKCYWKSLKNYRKEDKNFDGWLKQQLTIEVEDPAKVYNSAEIVWHKFKKTFTTLFDMVSYRPVFKLYVTQLLEELFQDNVMYTELRGAFMPLYELNGTVYGNEQFFEIFLSTVNEYRVRHPSFLGVRYIHSVYRGVTLEQLKTALTELIKLQESFPDFIVGFDFVGYEEEGHQLVYYHEVLSEFKDKVKFFFHAGESNWYGKTDFDLIDAVLLNTSRIGHGFALFKHPVVMDIVKDQKIAVEICPISNQVLMLSHDPRNHPAISLIANDFPVVICNDDPSTWGATGLSYDWYVVFMAMTSADAGIEILKELAYNSILYSGMGLEYKKIAIDKWNKDWKQFVEKLIKNNRYL